MRLRRRNTGRELVTPGSGIELLNAEDQEQCLSASFQAPPNLFPYLGWPTYILLNMKVEVEKTMLFNGNSFTIAAVLASTSTLGEHPGVQKPERTWLRGTR